MKPGIVGIACDCIRVVHFDKPVRTVAVAIAKAAKRLNVLRRLAALNRERAEMMRGKAQLAHMDPGSSPG